MRNVFNRVLVKSAILTIHKYLMRGLMCRNRLLKSVLSVKKKKKKKKKRIKKKLDPKWSEMGGVEITLLKLSSLYFISIKKFA